MADFLAHLPPNCGLAKTLLPYFKTLLTEIANKPLPSGIFPIVLDNPHSCGEVSATALLVYATAMGVYYHWLIDQRFQQLVEQVVPAMMAACDERVNVIGVTAGTAVFPKIFFIRCDRTESIYGVKQRFNGAGYGGEIIKSFF